MALAEGLQTNLKATLTPSLSNTGDLKGLSKRRMLTSSGKKAAGKEDIEKDILKLLERPQTSGMLAAALHRSSPDTLRRMYLVPMLKKGTIEKQGDYYKRAGVAEVQVAREHFDDLVKKSAFAQLPIMASLVQHCKTLNHGEGNTAWVDRIRKVCLGKKVPTFKCRPEHWTVETTPQFIQQWRDFENKDRLPGQLRQTIRYLHEYVLKKPITDEQKKLWGLDGKKDNSGIYNNVKLSAAQMRALIDYFLAKGDLETAAFVAYSIETFGRSEAVFLARTGTMSLVHRKREYVLVAGSDKKNFDPIAVEQFRIIAALHPTLAQIKVQEDDIYDGTLKEFKTTHAPWPKKIIDKHAVKTFAEHEATRKGKATYFGRDGEKFREFNVRMSITLRAAYRELGMLVSPEPQYGTPEFYFNMRPTYVFRHIGAHLWLGRLGGSYEALSEMGWEDPGIPKKYYAGYNAHLLDERIARIE